MRNILNRGYVSFCRYIATTIPVDRKITRQTIEATNIQGVALNVAHFESKITHLLYTAINTTEHGQVSQCLGFTKSLTSSIQRLGDVPHDNQGIAAISQAHLR